MNRLPLDGIRVLDLSRLLPGGFCSLLLADYGADVLKGEDTAGGGSIRWGPALGPAARPPPPATGRRGGGAAPRPTIAPPGGPGRRAGPAPPPPPRRSSSR